VRGRLLVALERHELAVGELAAVLQLPQSTVSRHLKTLVDAGWVTSRADGPSRRYRFAPSAREGEARRLWSAVREPLAALPSAEHDTARLRAVLAERRAATRAFFSGAAQAWDRLRAELFGARADLMALLALLDDRMTVGDLGCGTGAVADALAPFVGPRRRGRPLARDARRRAAAPRRARATSSCARATSRRCRSADGELDAALLVLTLHHMPDPEPCSPRPPGAAPGRPPRGDRHGPARPRGLPRRDGPRVARLRRGAARGWLHARASARCATRCSPRTRPHAGPSCSSPPRAPASEADAAHPTDAARPSGRRDADATLTLVS
jgi:DNA-binding transcriptional ArsR family regulator